MRIAYYITRFLYRDDADGRFSKYLWGGGEIAAYDLAVSMAKRGHEVKIFTSSADSRDSSQKYDGISVYRYGTRLAIRTSSIAPGLFRKPMRYAADIVHAHFTVPPASYAAALHAKKNKLPLVLTYHAEEQTNWGSLIRRTGAMLDNILLTRTLLPSAKAIISPSEQFIAESAFLGKYSDKVVTIPNGVNIEDFDIDCPVEEYKRKLALPLDSRVILFVGALSPHKMPNLLIKAMPAIIEKVPKAVLVIVGDGSLRVELERSAVELGIHQSVRFAGFVPRGEVSQYYRSADVFVLLSVSETFGIVLLEASAAGLPMIASDLEVFKPIVEDGYNGIVLRKLDENDLAQAVVRLLRDDSLRVNMGANARKKVGDYSWAKIAEETEGLYMSLLN
ncbi:glycosyltransferase family 4 protein [Chloroflexota bacterium]